MKVLITGATGYVGRNFIPALIEENSSVEILTINIDSVEAEKLFPYSQCQHIAVQDMKKIDEFKPELVFHLATLSTSRDDLDVISPMIEANIEFGVKLLHFMSFSNSVRLFINIGSFAEYAAGPDKICDAYLYTATKSAFRHFVDYYSRRDKFQYIHVVPYTLYGGIDTAKKLIDYMRESISAKDPVKMSPGEQILDFTHISDLVSFFLHIYKNTSKLLVVKPGEEFHIGTGVGTRVRDLASQVEIVYGEPCNIAWGGIPYRPLDTMYAVAPVDKNIQLLGWKAKTDLKSGLEQYRDAHRRS